MFYPFLGLKLGFKVPLFRSFFVVLSQFFCLDRRPHFIYIYSDL